MKYLFLAIAALLIGAAFLTARMAPDAGSEVPIIYWVTDANPARQEQVKLFHQWMVEQGHYIEHVLNDESDAAAFFRRNSSRSIRRIIREVNPHASNLCDWADDRSVEVSFPVTVRLPKAELKLDMANADRTKKVVQGVSGVAGDVMDQDSGSDLRYFRAIGLNTDVTEAAKELGFDMSATFPAIEPDLTLRDVDGNLRQYQFPCNVNASLFYVNRATFEQHGQPLPPRTWTIEEFERIGYAFVEAANKDLDKQYVFFINNIDFEVLRRTYGGSLYNETGTAAVLDEATRKAYRTYYKWSYEGKYRLMPNAGDKASFATESGYGGPDAQLFSHDDPARGQYAMFFTGRYLLIIFRQINEARAAQGKPPLDLDVVMPPHDRFLNTVVRTRAAAVYSLGKHPELATLFLAFLASKEYNEQIVKDGDALPPNPIYTKTEAYLRPPDYPEEWRVHEPFATAALEIAVGGSYSHFILQPVADRIENSWRGKYLAGLIDLDTAVREAEAALNAEIQRRLDEDRARDEPVLVPLYETLVERQKMIDERKARIAEHLAAGRPIPEEDKIPVEWIENAFHVAYYRHLGWLAESADAPDSLSVTDATVQ